jgi:hypothetical protein
MLAQAGEHIAEQGVHLRAGCHKGYLGDDTVVKAEPVPSKRGSATHDGFAASTGNLLWSPESCWNEAFRALL